jgi:hypothetical protein
MREASSEAIVNWWETLRGSFNVGPFVLASPMSYPVRLGYHL